MGVESKGEVNLEPSIRVAVLYWPNLHQLSSCSFHVQLSEVEKRPTVGVK
jgi:hypothetical protein